MSSDDESEDVGGLAVEEQIKFRVVASARLRSCVRVNDADVPVGPPNPAENLEDSPSWVGEMPLPRVLAERVTGSAIDHDEWDAVALAAFSKDNGGFLRGFNRRTNALLNSVEGEGDQFQWDVKLTRNIAPQEDLQNSNLTITKYKKAKKCLDLLWAILRNKEDALAQDVSETVHTDWFLLEPKLLARWLEKHIMRQPTQSVRQLRSCRSQSPERRRSRSASPPASARGRRASPLPVTFPPPAASGERAPPLPAAPAAPAPPVAPVPALANAMKQQLGFLMRRSKYVGDMLYSDNILRWLVDPQMAMPSDNLWAPRWQQYPVVQCQHYPINGANPNDPVGEKFVIRLFKSVQASSVHISNDPANIHPAAMGQGDAGGAGAQEQEEEGGGNGEGGGGGMGDIYFSESAQSSRSPSPPSPPAQPAQPALAVRQWPEQVAQAVAGYNEQAKSNLVMEAILAETVPELSYFVTEQEFTRICYASRQTKEPKSVKLLSYDQIKEVWEETKTHVLHKQDMLLLRFVQKQTQQAVGYALLSPLDLDICRVALVCSSDVLLNWTKSQLQKVYSKFMPTKKAPSDVQQLKLELMLFFLRQMGVVPPEGLTLEESSNLLDEEVRNKLIGYKSVGRFVHMKKTPDKKPLPAASDDMVESFNLALQSESNLILELHAACSSPRGLNPDLMMQAIVALCSNLGVQFVCIDLDTANTPVNYDALNRLGYVQANLYANAAYISSNRFEPQYSIRSGEVLLGRYAFTHVPVKKAGQ